MIGLEYSIAKGFPSITWCIGRRNYRFSQLTYSTDGEISLSSTRKITPPHAIAHSHSHHHIFHHSFYFSTLHNNASHVHHPCTATHPPDTRADPLLPRKSHRPLRATPERRLAPQKRHRRRHRPVLPLSPVSLRLVAS